MANEENLIPLNKRTKSEQREIARMGGRASGIARKKKADLKRTLETLLQSEVSNHKMKELLVSLGYEPTNETALVLVVLQKALNGDMRAVSQIRSFLQDDDSL